MAKIHMNDPEGYRGEMIEIGVVGRRSTRHAGHGVYELYDGSYAAKSFCGMASWRKDGTKGVFSFAYREGVTLPGPEFWCLPRVAQCGGCLRRFEAYAEKHGIDRSPPIRRGSPECATEEMIVSVEAFLHWLVRLFAHDFECLEEIPLYSYVG